MTRFNVVVERIGPVERATIPVEATDEEAARLQALKLAESEWAYNWYPYGLPQHSDLKAIKVNVVLQSRLGGFNETD